MKGYVAKYNGISVYITDINNYSPFVDKPNVMYVIEDERKSVYDVVYHGMVIGYYDPKTEDITPFMEQKPYPFQKRETKIIKERDFMAELNNMSCFGGEIIKANEEEKIEEGKIISEIENLEEENELENLMEVIHEIINQGDED